MDTSLKTPVALLALGLLFACDPGPKTASAKAAAPRPAANDDTAPPAADKASEPTGASDRAVAALEAAVLTSAPLQAKVVARLEAPAAGVWAYVSNNDNLQEYAAPLGISHVNIDDSNADADGVGVRRECAAMTGMKVKMMTAGLVSFFTDKFGGKTMPA